MLRSGPQPGHHQASRVVPGGARRYLRFSEETVRLHGFAPQQYQLMLAVKGLQLRHHSTVELVNRAQGQNLVQRGSDPDDARTVRVALTAGGEQALAQLGALHRAELKRMGAILTPPTVQPLRH
ncbi:MULTISPECIES: MarR family winged helix-turn-helix transcriptional regulator [unclassified Pseudonocardia]|uniref:MarR family winged helix-turn-helix transcriptional regulator n=1 Tax=unclassified Pseudonocardia TaxID=2619320 RepID=UPI000760ECF8